MLCAKTSIDPFAARREATACTSSNSRSNAYAAASPLLPLPRRSMAVTRKCGARCAQSGANRLRPDSPPCTRSSGGPEPAVIRPIGVPSALRTTSRTPSTAGEVSAHEAARRPDSGRRAALEVTSVVVTHGGDRGAAVDRGVRRVRQADEEVLVALTRAVAAHLNGHRFLRLTRRECAAEPAARVPGLGIHDRALRRALARLDARTTMTPGTHVAAP